MKPVSMYLAADLLQDVAIAKSSTHSAPEIIIATARLQSTQYANAVLLKGKKFFPLNCIKTGQGSDT